MNWSPNCKPSDIIPFHMLYRKGRNAATAVNTGTDKQTYGPHFNWDNGSSQAEWITSGIAGQGKRNLEEIFRFGFGNKEQTEPDLTTQAFAEAMSRLPFLAPSARSSFLYSSMLNQPELPGASSETGTKVTEFVLTSCLQTWLWVSCMPCFFSPMLLQSCPMWLP